MELTDSRSLGSEEDPSTDPGIAKDYLTVDIIYCVVSVDSAVKSKDLATQNNPSPGNPTS